MASKYKKMLPLVDQALVSGGNFITVMLGARLLSLDAQGKLGYILSAYVAVSVFSQVAIYQIASIDAPKFLENNYYALINLLQLLISATTSFVLAILLIGIGYYSGWTISFLEGGSVVFFLFFQQQADFVRRGAYIFSGVLLAVVSSLAVYPIRVLTLLLVKPHNILTFVLILGLTAIVPFLQVIYDLLRQRKNTSGFIQFVKRHFKKSKWLVMSAPFTWLWANVPVFLLGARGNFAQVGIFSTLRSISSIGNVFLELLETTVAASAGKKMLHDDSSSFHRLFSNIFVIGTFGWAIGFVVIVLGNKFFVRLLVGDIYEPYSRLLVVLWINTLFVFFYRLSRVKTRTLGNTRIVFRSLVFGSLVSTIIAMGVIPFLNIYGAAFAIGCAALSMWIFQIKKL